MNKWLLDKILDDSFWDRDPVSGASLFDEAEVMMMITLLFLNLFIRLCSWMTQSGIEDHDLPSFCLEGEDLKREVA